MVNKFYYCCLKVLVVCIFLQTAVAQNFELVDEEQYKEYYKKPIFVPDLRFRGEYQFYNLNFTDASDNSKILNWQDFELGLKSEVHENVSLNLTLSNNPYNWDEVKDNYQSYDLKQRQNRARENIGISLKKFFLEYNFNPTSIFRIGRQTINLGDKRGLIYQGEVDAFTLSCRLGSWCLEVGQANLGSNPNKVTWINFDYPVYQSIETIENYWIEDKTKQRYAVALNVEIYRINDKQERLALANYGGRTFNPYQNYLNQTVTSDEHFQDNGKSVFFDRDFFTHGMNLNLYQNNFGFLFNAIFQSGSKKYFYDDNTIPNNAQTKIAGSVYRLEWQQLAGNNSQFGLTGLVSSGKAAGDNTTDNLPWRAGFEYYEWNRGTYGDALIYFSKDYRGNAHSVGNLAYLSFYYKYYGSDNNFGVTTQIFNFARNEPVLASNGKLVSEIGLEWDVNIFVYLEKSLKVELDLGYFIPGTAYSHHESIQPSGNTLKNITRYSTSINYKF